MLCSDPKKIIARLYSQILDNTIHFMKMLTSIPTPLFRSERQAEILATLFFSDSKLSITDLGVKLGVPYPTIHREVGRLLKSGIFIETRVGNTILLSPNQSSPFYRPVLALLEVTSGPVPLLRETLGPISGVEIAYLFGSWAHRLLGDIGPVPNDVDVFVIGNPDVRSVNKACKEVGQRIGWEINAVILTQTEWNENTPFLTQAKSGGLIPIFEERTSLD